MNRKLGYILNLHIAVRVIIYVRIMYLALKIIRNSHEEGFKIGNVGKIIIDPVGAGKKSHSSKTEYRKLRQHL